MITLLRKGELRAPNGDPELQRALDTRIPFEYIIDWLRDREGLVGIENRVAAIQSGTASGKSITIPSEIFLSLVRPRYATGGGVICTQPRVLTAVDNARKIASIPKYAAHLKIGETIGWSTQYFKERPVRIGLLFATIGVLAMQLQLSSDEEIMNMYRYIIIDEVHERSLQADLTLAALKNFVHRNARNPRCPFIILMSATFDPFKVARYFLVPARSTFPDDQAHARALEAMTPDVLTPNVIICNALPSFPREKRWPSAPIANIIDEVARIVSDIMDTTPAPRESWDPTSTSPPTQERDDILVFMPGEKEIKPLQAALISENIARNRASKTTAEIVVLNRQTVTGNRRDYRDLDVPLREVNKAHGRAHERRVIISTTVAETGKTFNSLRYVIDSGFSREIQYNPSIKAEVLLSIPAQVSRIEQRWGRVGRIFPGVVYPLYTLETYKKLPESQLPEILMTDITPIILQLVFEQQKIKYIAKDPAPYFRIQDMDLVDLPTPDALLDALERARVLGFIAHDPPKFAPDLAEFLDSRADASAHSESVGITRMGRIALELSMLFGDLENMRMVLAGFQWNYKPVELIMIAARGALEPIMTDLSTRTKIQYSQVYRELLSGNPQYADIRDPAHAWHMILSDTFFDAIAIGITIDRLFATGSGGMQVVREWARRVSLDLESVLRFVELRDNMASALIRLGFNVHGGASIADMMTSQFPVDPEELARAILGYKRCIYDGFRLNHIKWSAKNSQYMTDTGLHVAAGYIEKLFMIDTRAPTQTMPASIVFDKYTGKADRETGAYDIISTGGVSILDGFIGHDRVFSQ